MASDSLCLVIQRQHIAQENQLWNLQSVDKRALVRCVVVMSTETLIARKRCNVAMPMPEASDFPDLLVYLMNFMNLIDRGKYSEKSSH